MKKKPNPALMPVAALALLSFVFVAAALYNVFLIKMDKAELAVDQEILDTNIRRRDYLRDMAANRDAVEAKIKNFTEMLPGKAAQDDIFLKAHQLGIRYEVTISNLSFVGISSEPESQAEKLGFYMSLEGGYENIMKMLENLAGVDKFTHITYISLDGSTADRDIIKAQVSVDLYYYPGAN